MVCVPGKKTLMGSLRMKMRSRHSVLVGSEAEASEPWCLGPCSSEALVQYGWAFPEVLGKVTT